MCQSNNKKEETVLVLPSDTIQMQYSNEYPRYCFTILDGIVNDSLHFDVFFDTGSAGNYIRIPESFKNLFDSDSAFVQIGKFKKQMGIHYWGNNQSSIISIIGNNTIMVGWQFFENQIIEFDFQNQRIVVYEELPDITEYSKIKIELSQSSQLIIPVQVVVQEKTLEDSVVIDTGHNGYVTLSSKHFEKQGLFATYSNFGTSKTCSIVSADTIKIGDLYVTNQNENMNIFYNNRSLGLLGTKTMENFSVILDLINYDLYLKKVDK
jgi:predicted aspartyl protease